MDTELKEIIQVLAMSEAIWGRLAQADDPELTARAWQVVARPLNLQPGELTSAWRIYAESSTFPPKPGELLEIVKHQRVVRAKAQKTEEWRRLGRPVEIEGRVEFMDELEEENRELLAHKELSVSNEIRKLAKEKRYE